MGIWNHNRDTNIGQIGHVNENETVLDQMIDAVKLDFLDEKKPEEVGGHEEACKNSTIQWFNCDKVGSWYFASRDESKERNVRH